MTTVRTGIVKAFNVSPKGMYEGLLLEEDGELIQVNFGKDIQEEVAESAQEGSEIRVEVEPEETHGEPQHEVFHLVSLKNSKKAGGHKSGEFSGKVTRLNYALHGEVNGGILDTGDFLHVKPHGAAALKLRVGMKVKGTGSTRPMVGGKRVIEADVVNGVSLENKPKPRKKAH